MFEKLKNYIAEKNPVENLIGIGVIFLAFWFLSYAIIKIDFSSNKKKGGYEIEATFSRVGGINEGSDVRINGIKVGNVVGMSLDDKTYRAVLRLSIRNGVKIPDDSKVVIASDGVVGSNYVSVNLGHRTEYLKAGNRLRGEPYKSLEDMVGDLIFSITSK